MDDIFNSYGEEVAALSASRSTTEPSGYPAIKTLLFKMLEPRNNPVRGSRIDDRIQDRRRPMHEEWGDATRDLYTNEVMFRHVPERVWGYELGGYPVIEKWHGYRDRGRRPDIPLSVQESAHLRGMVQRLAAVLRLHATLDGLYECACQDCFSGEELGL